MSCTHRRRDECKCVVVLITGRSRRTMAVSEILRTRKSPKPRYVLVLHRRVATALLSRLLYLRILNVCISTNRLNLRPPFVSVYARWA